MKAKILMIALIGLALAACGGGGEQPGGAPPAPPPTTGGPPPPGPGGPTPNQGSPTLDTTPPTVGSTTPATSAENVDPAIRIIVNFSEAIKPETINAESFLISRAEGAIRGQIIVAADRLSAQFIPERLLRALTQHSVVIRTAVADLADNRLAQDYTLTFTTMADTTPPRVVATTPATGAVDGELINPIVIQFSEEMDRSTINDSAISITRRYFDLLQENGERELPVEGTVQLNENGMTATFIPQRRLALLTRYTISVRPTAQDLARNNLETYTAQFTTRDGVWQNPELIEQDESGDGSNPRVGMDNAGNAIAVWNQRIAGVSNIWANRYRINPTGNRWENETPLENDSGDISGFDLAVAPNGQAIAVWSQRVATARDLRANVFNGTGWQATANTIEEMAGGAGVPLIGYSNLDDDYFVIWPQEEGRSTNLYVDHYLRRADGIQGWERLLLESGDGPVSQLSLAPNLVLGQIFTFWLQDQDVYRNIYRREREGVAAGWQGAEVIVDNSWFDLEESKELLIQLGIEGPALAFGTAVGSPFFLDGFRGVMLFPIVNRRTGEARILSRNFGGGGVNTDYPLGVIGISDNTPILATGLVQGLKVVTDSRANLFATWQQGTGVNAESYVQRFDSWAVREGRTGVWDWLTTPLGAPGVSDGIPRLGVDNNGNALVVWAQGNNVVANRFRINSGWRTAPGQPPISLENLAGTSQGVNITVNDDGYAVAVWSQQTGGRLSIYAARFE